MAVAIQLERVVAAESTARDRLIDLMNRYEAPLSGYLRALTGDSEVAFDCAQDAFLRAYEHLVKGRDVNGQWLYKVGRNRAMDHHRNRGRFDSDPETLDAMSGRESGFSDRVIQTRNALQRLNPDDRELLYLAIVDRFKTEEIGAMLGIRSGAVRVRLFRARERFREVYGDAV